VKYVSKKLDVTRGRIDPRSERCGPNGRSLGKRRSQARTPRSPRGNPAQRNFVGADALSEVVAPETPVIGRGDETGSAQKKFAVEVIASRDGEKRRAAVKGQDSYALSAPMVTETIERWHDGRFKSIGAHPAGAIFNASDFLTKLDLSRPTRRSCTPAAGRPCLSL
jgi:hypothetical protein